MLSIPEDKTTICKAVVCHMFAGSNLVLFSVGSEDTEPVGQELAATVAKTEGFLEDSALVPITPNMFGPVSGAIEGKESLEEATKREVWEELGLSIPLEGLIPLQSSNLPLLQRVNGHWRSFPPGNIHHLGYSLSQEELNTITTRLISERRSVRLVDPFDLSKVPLRRAAQGLLGELFS